MTTEVSTPEQWFKAAFEGVTATDSAKDAAMAICRAYGIKGQADPGYIANVITSKTKPPLNTL